MQTLTFELQMHVQSADGVAARAAGARVPAVTRTQGLSAGREADKGEYLKKR